MKQYEKYYGKKQVLSTEVQMEPINGFAKCLKTEKVMSKSRAILIMTATSSLFFVLGYQVSAFSAYYVVMTQYFDVSKAAAGWIGSVQFGMGCLLGRVGQS